MLSAARKVFRESGYESSSVADIVREAGVAQGTFYLYFPSKQSIAVTLRDNLMDSMTRSVESRIKADSTFEQQIKALVAGAFRVAEQNRDLFRLAFIGSDEVHDEMHSESAAHASFLNLAVKIISAAKKSGDCAASDPVIAARLITGLIQHAVVESFMLGDDSEAPILEKGVTEMLLGALLQPG